MKESDILFEIGDYWVAKSDTHQGYDVFKCGVTHSVRCAQIGYKGEKGLERAKSEAIKRKSKQQVRNGQNY
jgi:hypothetical protein